MLEEPNEFVFADHVSGTLKDGIIHELIQMGVDFEQRKESGFVILKVRANRLEFVRKFLLQEELSGTLIRLEPK